MVNKTFYSDESDMRSCFTLFDDHSYHRVVSSVGWVVAEMCHRKQKQGAVSVAGPLAQLHHVKWLRMSSEDANTVMYLMQEVKPKALTTMARMTMMMMMMMMVMMKTIIMTMSMTTMMILSMMKNKVTLLMSRAAWMAILLITIK